MPTGTKKVTEPTATVEGNILTIQIPLNMEGTVSGSGKTTTHAYFRTDPRSESCPKLGNKPLTVQVNANTKI